MEYKFYVREMTNFANTDRVIPKTIKTAKNAPVV